MGYGWGCGTERKTQGERASVERCGSGLRHHLVESTEAYPSGSPREIGAFGLKVSQGGTVTWTKDKSFFFFPFLIFPDFFFFFFFRPLPCLDDMHGNDGELFEVSPL